MSCCPLPYTHPLEWTSAKEQPQIYTLSHYPVTFNSNFLLKDGEKHDFVNVSNKPIFIHLASYLLISKRLKEKRLFPFILPQPNRKKKEERHQHFFSIDITLRSDSLDLNRRWQLKAGVYPKEDNSVRDGGFPANSSLAGPFPSYIVVAPYISAGMSLLLKPAVQNGA